GTAVSSSKRAVPVKGGRRFLRRRERLCCFLPPPPRRPRAPPSGEVLPYRFVKALEKPGELIAPRLPVRASIYIAPDGRVHFGALFAELVPVAEALGSSANPTSTSTSNPTTTTTSNPTTTSNSNSE